MSEQNTFEMTIKLLSYLPIEIKSRIISFTYNTQRRELMDSIKTFSFKLKYKPRRRSVDCRTGGDCDVPYDGFCTICGSNWNWDD